MSDMEPEARDFLKRVSLSIGVALLWLFINITVGIFGGWLFFYKTPTIGNYIFYVWLIASVSLLVWAYLRLWKNRFH
jgi:hypothetical protein